MKTENQFLPLSLSFSPVLINIKHTPTVGTEAINYAAPQNASYQMIAVTGRVVESLLAAAAPVPYFE